MDPTPSLAKSPHDNIVGAVAIDDRAGPTGRMMSILFPKAEVDLATAFQHDCLSMPAKFRYCESCSFLPVF